MEKTTTIKTSQLSPGITILVEGNECKVISIETGYIVKFKYINLKTLKEGNSFSMINDDIMIPSPK